MAMPYAYFEEQIRLNKTAGPRKPTDGGPYLLIAGRLLPPN